MGKNGKRKKNLINKFKDIDNETLLDFLKTEINRYVILEKSEHIAKEILLKHGVNTFCSINEEQKNRYNHLIELATLRNLNIPSSWYDAEITNIDIIKRIDEFKYEEIRWIDTHNYLFDLSYEENIYPSNEIIEMFPEDNILESDRKISEVISQYETIIIKEFDEEIFEQYENLKRASFHNTNLKTIYESVAPLDKIPNILLRRKQR